MSEEITNSRARSTKTRIETIEGRTGYINGIHSRARSTKTRIETPHLAAHLFFSFYSRARSTKTRIETLRKYHTILFHCIREQDPLKQGLKQNCY